MKSKLNLISYCSVSDERNQNAVTKHGIIIYETFKGKCWIRKYDVNGTKKNNKMEINVYFEHCADWKGTSICIDGFVCNFKTGSNSNVAVLSVASRSL
jgi:hypothetical protein